MQCATCSIVVVFLFISILFHFIRISFRMLLFLAQFKCMQLFVECKEEIQLHFKLRPWSSFSLHSSFSYHNFFFFLLLFIILFLFIILQLYFYSALCTAVTSFSCLEFGICYLIFRFSFGIAFVSFSCRLQAFKFADGAFLLRHFSLACEGVAILLQLAC